MSNAFDVIEKLCGHPNWHNLCCMFMLAPVITEPFWRASDNKFLAYGVLHAF